MEKTTVEIKQKPKSYDIYVGYDFFDEIAQEILVNKYGSRYAVITDNVVEGIYGHKLLKALDNLGIEAHLIVFKAGEEYKTRETKEYLENKLLDLSFTRDCAIIALGGGVVGDIGGFVAATYMRGIPVIQIPTTVIAQADSSIGGKTAVDTPHGKNLIGAFHHPKAVFIDISTLKTLDDRNYRSGFMEVIKHGIIKDIELFELIEKNTAILLERTSEEYEKLMPYIMKRNCAIKSEVVMQDDKESNLRKILNYGHTVGHAIETLSNYNLLHGEAVAIGTTCEAFFSYKLGYCSKDDYMRQLELIKAFELPYTIPETIETKAIIDKTCLDKKAQLGEPEFVLAETIGRTKTFENGKSTLRLNSHRLIELIEEFRAIQLF